MTGEEIALGVELIRPVSFLLTKENVVGTFHLLPNGEIQAFPEKPIVTVLLAELEKSYVTRFSPNDQFSDKLKSVQMYEPEATIPEQPV